MHIPPETVQGWPFRQSGQSKSMYENAFNSIERDLRAEEGIANELDYVEQISWVGPVAVSRASFVSMIS